MIRPYGRSVRADGRMRQIPDYTSQHQFEADVRPDGLMLVCSDGRFESHVDDFRNHLRNSLSLQRMDRYFLPGAQLQFVSAAAGYTDTDLATSFWSRFLIDHHAIGAVVIIGHEQCAAYRFAPAYQNLDDDGLRQRQSMDLRQARDLMISEYPNVHVYLYYMRPTVDNAAVEFFAVE
jgi:hypothetical protein